MSVNPTVTVVTMKDMLHEPNRRIELRASVYKTEALPLSELGIGHNAFASAAGLVLGCPEPVTGIEPALLDYETSVIAIILYRRI